MSDPRPRDVEVVTIHRASGCLPGLHELRFRRAERRHLARVAVRGRRGAERVCLCSARCEDEARRKAAGRFAIGEEEADRIADLCLCKTPLPEGWRRWTLAQEHRP